MYIAPDTTINLLHNIPLDNTYRNSLYFADIQSQTAYFTSKIKHTVPNNYYQRKERGYLRVQLSIGQCFDCNYIMYKNNSFENKWIYAFITSVNYINNAVTEIQYEVDVLQTWYFDYTLHECFVERETVRNDTVGAHTLPENLDIGGFYNFSHQTDMSRWDSYSVTVISAYQDTTGEQTVNGKYVCGIYSGSDYLSARMDNPSDLTRLNDYLTAVVGANQLNSIVSLIYTPTAITPDVDPETGELAEEPDIGYYQVPKHQDTLGSYTPRNKKLLTFPYNALYVHNSLGNSKLYRYEQFGASHDDIGNVCEFVQLMEFSGSPEVCIYPNNYMRDGNIFDYDDGLSITGFPQCSFSYDVYKAWLANGGAVKTTAQIAGSALGIIGGITMPEYEATGLQTLNNRNQWVDDFDMTRAGSLNSIGMASGALGIANSVADVAIKSIQPNAQVGTQQSTIMTSNRLLGFYCAQAHVRPEIATIIDDYFDIYGYQVNYRKVPNRNNRPHWTYLKTRDCDITGSIPVNDMAKICSIYNNGITWWVNGNEVGDYSLDNSPS